MKKVISFVFASLLAASASAQDAGQTGPVAQPPPPPPPPAQNLGGPGESCRARTDCKTGLKCMGQVCTDEHEGETCGATSDCGGELKCINNKCTSTLAAAHGEGAGGAGGAPDMTKWLHFSPTDGGTHPFVGLTLAGGFDTLGISGTFSGGFDTFDGAFLFALDVGLFIGHSQLELEVAPFTFMFDARGAGPAFEVNGSYAYYIPISEGGTANIYWPLRIGAGMMAGGNNTGGLVLFQARADVVGPSFQIGHLMIDLHLPSFRYLITDKSGEQSHVLEWLFGTTLSYAF